MKIKVAEYIADFFAGKGVRDIFTITGGGAMHLNDAFGHCIALIITMNRQVQWQQRVMRVSQGILH